MDGEENLAVTGANDAVWVLSRADSFSLKLRDSCAPPISRMVGVCDLAKDVVIPELNSKASNNISSLCT